MKRLAFWLVISAVIFLIVNDYLMKFRPFVFPFVRRKCDKFGCGGYGASRDGGTRKHNGMDVLTVTGQKVFAPFGGKIRLFKPYPGYSGLNGVEIQGKAYKVKLMYVLAASGIKSGSVVKAGQLIGYAESLQIKYPGIANHIHSEIWLAGTSRNPTAFFPPDSLQIA